MNKIIKNHENGFKKRQKLYPELFDLEFWRKEESYKIIKEYILDKESSITEIGCLTGHHLILLAEEGYTDLIGIDFVTDAVEWGIEKSNGAEITWLFGRYPDMGPGYAQDNIILFDVLEHVPNIDSFLTQVSKDITNEGQVLILVPKGREFFDKCHINFYPDTACLKNLLSLYFKVDIIKDVDNGKKIFARCTK